jgi:hypothetical protein
MEIETTGLEYMIGLGRFHHILTHKVTLDSGTALVSKPYSRAKLLEQVRVMLDSGND